MIPKPPVKTLTMQYKKDKVETFFDKLKRLFRKKRVNVDPPTYEEIMFRISNNGAEESSFLKGYQEKKEEPVIHRIIKHEYVKKPEINISEIKNLAKNSIIISLDYPSSRWDIKFIGNSRIDGKPMYIYTGDNFSEFPLEYEELFVD